MSNEKICNVIKVILLSSSLVIISFLLQYNIGLNLADEGYLWYGAIQTASGSVPIRDFQSYDPGRYYWSAFWMLLFGKGIIALRISLAIFQAIGLTFGLLALRRVIRSWPSLCVAALILLMWMIPMHKIFELSLAMMSVYFAVRLIENPSLSRYFVSGIFVGMTAVFGRNHGFYNLLAFSSLMLFIRFKFHTAGLIKNAAAWIGGILLGYSPIPIMILIVPHLFSAFWESFAFLLRRGSTNMPLPIPWPWRPDYAQLPVAESIIAFTTGLFFLLLPLFFAFIIIYLLISPAEQLKKKPLLIASAAIGVFYMHYAFARADVGHLAQGITPMLIAIPAFLFTLNVNHRKILCSVGLAILLVMSSIAAGTQSWFYQKSIAAGTTESFVRIDIINDKLWVPSSKAKYINSLKMLNSSLIRPKEGILFVPWQPTMYAVLQRKSPLRELCFFDKSPESRQKEMIKELEQKKVNWVILDNTALDGREEFRFSNTHKLLWRYFKEHFDWSDHSGLTLLHRK